MSPNDVPDEGRDYFLERKYPSFGNLSPRDISSRAAKEVCDDGRGVGQLVDGKRLGVYLDFSASIKRLGESEVRARYGNLFDMYQNITGENAYKQPMRIFPAVHYTMGGLWVDYNLQSNIPGLFVGGEANFSDHGANRLGASALMQGLADGYFVLPYTVTDFLAGEKPGSRPSKDAPEFQAAVKDVNDRVAKLLSVNGTKSPRYYHQALGKITWEQCGMARDKAGLEGAIRDLQALREDFWKNVKVVGSGDALAPELERAGRVADALARDERPAQGWPVPAFHPPRCQHAPARRPRRRPPWPGCRGRSWRAPPSLGWGPGRRPRRARAPGQDGLGRQEPGCGFPAA
jgi:succinate dehydrogenase / fumarate reductase flavoprotein subunit